MRRNLNPHTTSPNQLLQSMQIAENLHMFLGRDRPIESHSFLLLGKQTILIDTGMETKNILLQLNSLNIRPNDLDLIVNTHCHFDHIRNNKSLKEATGAKLAAGEEDAPHIEASDGHTGARIFGEKVSESQVDVLLKGGEELNDFEVLYTPGHTSGSVCLFRKSDGILISGDTIFANGYPGRMDLPSGSEEEMSDTLKRLEKLGVEKIFPAHGVAVLRNARQNIETALSYVKV